MPAQQLSPEPLGVTLCKKQKGKAWRWPWLCLICSFHNCLSPETTISLFLRPAVRYFGIGTTALMKYISAPSQPHFNHHHGLQCTTASFTLHKNHLQVSPIPYSIFNPVFVPMPLQVTVLVACPTCSAAGGCQSRGTSPCLGCLCVRAHSSQSLHTFLGANRMGRAEP